MCFRSKFCAPAFCYFFNGEKHCNRAPPGRTRGVSLQQTISRAPLHALLGCWFFCLFICLPPPLPAVFRFSAPATLFFAPLCWFIFRLFSTCRASPLTGLFLTCSQPAFSLLKPSVFYLMFFFVLLFHVFGPFLSCFAWFLTIKLFGARETARDWQKRREMWTSRQSIPRKLNEEGPPQPKI